jgi:hypothetical protein
VATVQWTCQQLINQCRPLAGIFLIEKRDSLFDRRNGAGQVQVYATQKFRIVGWRRRGDLALRQRGIDVAVDRRSDFGGMLSRLQIPSETV